MRMVLIEQEYMPDFALLLVNYTAFVQAAGDTKSGDNDALKHLLATMSPAEKARRIAVPPQCSLNSYLWRPSVRQWTRWLISSGKIRSGIWRPGHLLVHLAGWDNYKVCFPAAYLAYLATACTVEATIT
jgi:hypothetical protein